MRVPYRPSGKRKAFPAQHGEQNDRPIGRQNAPTKRSAKRSTKTVSKKTTSKTARSSVNERAAKLEIYRAIGL
jgi:hypothetical protein